MFSINITFIAQIINFFIAWWLLDRIFLRKAYHIIMQERELLKNLASQERFLLESIKDKEREYRQQKNLFYQDLIKRMPVSEKKFVLEPVLEIKSVQFAPEVKDATIHAYSDLIVNQVTKELKE